MGQIHKYKDECELRYLFIHYDLFLLILLLLFNIMLYLSCAFSLIPYSLGACVSTLKPIVNLTELPPLFKTANQLVAVLGLSVYILLQLTP